jgi:hypothetical protein
VIEIIQSKEALSIDGDILGLGNNKYFVTVPKEYYKDKKFVPLYPFSPNPWKALSNLKILTSPLSDDLKYKCPFSENVYYRAVPILLFSENSEKIINDSKIFYKCLYLNQEWLVDTYFSTKGTFQETKITKSFLGHGYSFENLPHDGFSEYNDFLVFLNNGDAIGFKVQIWYNN